MLGQNIVRAIKENFKSHRKCNKDFQIDNPMLSKDPNMKKEDLRLKTRWKAPPMGWLKGNFDGAAKGNPGKETCGGVLRDHTGNIIDAIAIPIGISNSHKAEVTAVIT